LKYNDNKRFALEKMQSNQVLKVILDFVSAFTNVPKSVEKQKLGKILKKPVIGKICELIIQKT
jgi:TusA-related sulfurtransferase